MFNQNQTDAVLFISQRFSVCKFFFDILLFVTHKLNSLTSLFYFKGHFWLWYLVIDIGSSERLYSIFYTKIANSLIVNFSTSLKPAEYLFASDVSNVVIYRLIFILLIFLYLTIYADLCWQRIWLVLRNGLTKCSGGSSPPYLGARPHGERGSASV